MTLTKAIIAAAAAAWTSAAARSWSAMKSFLEESFRP
jgi:hypothetical protein